MVSFLLSIILSKFNPAGDIGSFRKENDLKGTDPKGKRMSAAPLSRGAASPPPKGKGGEDVLRFTNTVIMGHNKALDHVHTRNVAAVENILLSCKMKMALAFSKNDPETAEAKADEEIRKLKEDSQLKVLLTSLPYCPYITDDRDTSTENPHHLTSPCRALRDSTASMDLMEAGSDTQSQSQSQTY